MTQAKLLLRIGLAFVFLYASYGSLTTPADWIWYIPAFLQAIVPGETQLFLHGIAELVLGVWLLSGWKGFYAAIIASADLLVITVINFEIMDIVFRDVGLFFAACTLTLLEKEKIKKS